LDHPVVKGRRNTNGVEPLLI